MIRVRYSSALAGATALVLVLGTPTFAQQAVQQDQPAQESQQQTTLPDENHGAAAEVVKQLEQAQQALNQDDMDAAREALGRANDMILNAELDGGEDRLLKIQAQLQQAMTALNAEDAESAQAAIGSAAEALVVSERGSAQQGAQQITAQQTGMPADQQTTAIPAQQPSQADSGMSREALWTAQDALGLARQEVEAALRSLEEAEAALQQYGTAMGEKEGDARISVINEGQTQANQSQQATRERQASQDQQPMQEQQAAATAEPQVPRRLSEEETYRMLGLGDRQIGDPAEMLTITVADMRDRRVVTFDGDRVGDIDRIVDAGGQLFAVIEHGGFLGIGENHLAIPADRLGMRGEEIVLLGLTKEHLDRMPDNDLSTGQELSQEQAIEVGRYN